MFIDFLEIVKTGRAIYLPPGEIIIPVVTESGEKQMTIKYIVGNSGTIRWDKQKKRPVWYGFTAEIEKEGTLPGAPSLRRKGGRS